MTTTDRPVRSRAHTRARLLAAAADVFVEKGVEGASVDDLVTAAGYTRGAFYSNFSSMEEVFEEFFATTTQEDLAAVRAAIDAIPSENLSIDSLMTVLDGIGETTSVDPRSRYILVRELELNALRDERARAVYDAYLDTLGQHIEEIIVGVAARMGRRMVIPTRELGLLLHGLYMDATGRGLVRSDTSAPGRRLAPLLEALVLGASTPL